MSSISLRLSMFLSRSPALVSLGIHLAAWMVVFAASRLNLAGGLPILLLTQGLLAGLFSRLIHMPAWWQAINLAFFPLLGLALQVEIPPYWYLAGFILLAITSLGALGSRVPLYLSSQRAMTAVAERLPQRPSLRIIDLGCGLGGMLKHLAGRRPGLELHGVDTAPLPWFVSRLRLASKAQIRLGSFWDEDLSCYDVVYAYLSPAPMPRLWEKARREMRPGSLFISNTFTVPGNIPDEVVELNDLSHARLFLWRM